MASENGQPEPSLIDRLKPFFKRWFPGRALPRAVSPFASILQHDATVPLVKEFRFVHEPVDGNTANRFVGRQGEINSFAQRILFSKGGSFLVTGYRGVGKTSFVHQVVRTLENALPWADEVLGKTEIVDVYLNVARPVEPSEIMHHIIRRLQERLIEKNFYQLLDPKLREELKLAYDRTSVNMARKLAETSERTFGFNEASLGGDWMKAAVKMGWSSKRGKSENLEMSYLGYDDKAAEHDIIRISRQLADRGYLKPVAGWQRDGLLLRRKDPEQVRLKIVFVFDELDKLEEFNAVARKSGKPSKPVIDEILGSLKNLFTTSGVTFIFVAGKDLQERWLEDVGKGDSVYESVFSFDKYLPCLWADVDAICNTLLANAYGMPSYNKQVYEEFKKYLIFKGRGIPRRIIRTFNEFVAWHGEQPLLAFSRQAVRQIRFFAGLQDLLNNNEKILFGETHEEVPGTQSDKRRLGVYYLLDWILRHSTEEFTLKDVLNASKKLSAKIALAEEIAPKVAEDLIKLLVNTDYLQEVDLAQNRVQLEGKDLRQHAKVVAERRYRISPRRLGEMMAVGGDLASDLPSLPEPVAGDLRDIGTYKVVRMVGRGGMGTVYEATDEVSGQRVAIKVSLDNANPEMLARFEREAQIMKKLNHPNIVRLFEFGKEKGHLFIVMEYLDGITLEALLAQRGKLPLELALSIARPLTDAVAYVHREKIVRNDIKPGNIMLTTAGKVCLLDFGISRYVQPRQGLYDTKAGVIIGTPQFMAPEQLTEHHADERSDIYAVGIVIYKMLTGHFPFEGASVIAVVKAQIETEPDPPSQYVSSLPKSIDEIVLKCLEKEPQNRFQTMDELKQALDDAGGPANVDLAAALNKVAKKAKQVARIDVAVTGEMERAPRLPESPTRSVQPPISPPASRSRSDLTVGLRAREFKPVDEKPRVTLIDGDPVRVQFNVTRIQEPGEYLSFVLEPRTTIGRSSDNIISLIDNRVSRYHAQLTFMPLEIGGEVPVPPSASWFIQDLNTSEGTRVNNERVLSLFSLKNGDVIEIGEQVFVFTVGPTWRPHPGYVDISASKVNYVGIK